MPLGFFLNFAITNCHWADNTIKLIVVAQSFTANMAASTITPLTGKALLERINELGNLSKSDLARACGFYSVTKAGKERVNFTAFYEALLDAKGVNLDEPKGRKGRQPGFKARVQSNGNLLIGKAYTEKLNLKPGDTFEIKIGRKQITLTPSDDLDLGDEDLN